MYVCEYKYKSVHVLLTNKIFTDQPNFENMLSDLNVYKNKQSFGFFFNVNKEYVYISTSTSCDLDLR